MARRGREGAEGVLVSAPLRSRLGQGAFGGRLSKEFLPFALFPWPQFLYKKVSFSWVV
jgi:hypothetical protein